jgi:hypothetical protein
MVPVVYRFTHYWEREGEFLYLNFSQKISVLNELHASHLYVSMLNLDLDIQDLGYILVVNFCLGAQSTFNV